MEQRFFTFKIRLFNVLQFVAFALVIPLKTDKIDFRKGDIKMSVKRKVGVLLSVLLIVCICVSSFPVFAGTVNSTSEENPAWLSDVYVRESATDFVKNEMVPRAEGVYSRTLGGFRKEVSELKKLCKLSIDDLSNSYIQVIEKVYQLMDQTGIFAEYDTMKNYLVTEHKIVFPADDSSVNKTYVAVAYACLKYDLLYPVTGKHFSVPAGTSLNRTVVLIAATLLSDTVDSDIETIEDYAILNLKKSLIAAGYPVSDNADPEEILMLYKIMMAEKQGYKISNHNVSSYTQKDIEYLNGAYAASLIKSTYGVSPTPEDAYIAAYGPSEDLMPMLILGLMIESKGESTVNDNSLEDLFKHACRLGFFDLDNEFYSDIYEYDVYLQYDCEYIWITPFAYATELGSDKTQYVSITINGTSVKSGSSHKFQITGDVTQAKIKLSYNDGSLKGNATYTIYIHNGTKDLPENPDLPIPPFYDDSTGGSSSGGTTGGSSSGGTSSGEYIFQNSDGLAFTPYEIGGESSLPGFSTSGGNSSLSGNIGNSSKVNGTSSEDGFNVKVIIIYAVAAVVIIGAGVASFFIIKKKKGPFKKK